MSALGGLFYLGEGCRGTISQRSKRQGRARDGEVYRFLRAAFGQQTIDESCGKCIAAPDAVEDFQIVIFDRFRDRVLRDANAAEVMPGGRSYVPQCRGGDLQTRMPA